LGTTPENIDFAEDRQKHSAMLDTLGIDQVSAAASAAASLWQHRPSLYQ
jgi:hypothetical protein